MMGDVVSIFDAKDSRRGHREDISEPAYMDVFDWYQEQGEQPAEWIAMIIREHGEWWT